MAAKVTVVPAKAGIQEIPRKRAGRLPSVLDSGFRRNDGFMLRLTGHHKQLPAYHKRLSGKRLYGV